MALHPHAVQRMLAERIAPLASERVPLERALGRVLATEAIADRDQPPTSRSAMDGYACHAADASGGAQLQVIETIEAGMAPRRQVAPGTCARILTGAVIPEGADCVVMQEAVDLLANDAIAIRVAARTGQHILPRGESARAGEVVLPAGTLLGAAQLGVLAAIGVGQVPLRRAPRVHLVSTGNELRGVGDAVEPHQVRNSNAPALAAMCGMLGEAQVTLHPPIPDDLDRLTLHFAEALDQADLVLSSGGASVGPTDFVLQALRNCGVDIWLERVAMKPGKPVGIGARGDTLCIALPGSPLAALTACRNFVVPACRLLQGHPEPWGPQLTVRVTATIANKPGRARYQLVALQQAGDGVIEATPVVTASVGDLIAAGRADGVIEIAADLTEVTAGTLLPCLLWRAWPR